MFGNKYLALSLSINKNNDINTTVFNHYHIANTLPSNKYNHKIINGEYSIDLHNGCQLADLYNIPIVENTAEKQASIAIIVPHASPHNMLAKDLKAYWRYNFGYSIKLPAINIHTMPDATFDSDWYIQECIDVMITATVNTNACIHVVEAKSSLLTDMIDAISYATNVLDVDIISMSCGCNDTKELASYYNICSSNKCFVASSGDSNSISWPSVLPTCISVGGTTLIGDHYSTKKETKWCNSGCGYSISQLKLLCQDNINMLKYRMVPDISMMADPKYGIIIVSNQAWYAVGGTSVSCPIFAGILSLANQERFNNNKMALTTSDVINCINSNKIESNNIDAKVICNYLLAL